MRTALPLLQPCWRKVPRVQMHPKDSPGTAVVGRIAVAGRAGAAAGAAAAHTPAVRTRAAR